MIRRYIIWRNRNAHDRRLRELVNRANVADALVRSRGRQSSDTTPRQRLTTMNVVTATQIAATRGVPRRRS